MMKGRTGLLLALATCLLAGCAQKPVYDDRFYRLSERLSRLEEARSSQLERQVSQPLATLSNTIVELSARAQRSVVHVSAEPGVVINSGTGFVYNRDGIILTNDHLVKVVTRLSDGQIKNFYKEQVTVRFHDGRSIKGRLIGVDPETDLAAVRVETDHLPPPLELATRRVRQGEMAFSIGHPRGLDYSVEWRPISAPYRIGSLKGTLLHQIGRGFFVGNSGGPIIDLEGKVIGMAYSSFRLKFEKNSKTNVLYAPIGWAIPAETMARVAPELIHGKHRITEFVRSN
jgi:S1-C subfamily serine protease